MHQRRKSKVVGRTSRHHGWANLGNQEEPALGSARTDEARLATSHRFSNGEGVRCSRKGRRSRSPSLRGSRAGQLWFGCPHVEVQLQKSVGDNWSRISSAYALQKEWQGRVNGGLARSEDRRVKPSVSASSETKSRVGLTGNTGEDRRQTQGDARVSFNGLHIAKSSERVAGPGL